MLDATSRRTAQREQTAAEREVAAARARRVARRTRTAALVILAVSLVLSIAAVVVSIVASTAQVEPIAARLAEPVAQRVLALGRDESVKGARADLDAANARLVSRGLPVFAQPPPNAPSFIVQRQAARAWALGDYPEDLAALVRAEVAQGRRPAAQPVVLPIPDLGDSLVTVIPADPDSSSSTTGRPRSDPRSTPGTAGRDGGGAVTTPRGSVPRAPSRPSASSRPAPSIPAPQPPPAPPAPRRGLFPLLPDLPLRVPLLSQ